MNTPHVFPPRDAANSTMPDLRVVSAPPIRVFVPRDTAALAVGANAVAQAICEEAAARGLAIDLVRNGSRGLL